MNYGRSYYTSTIESCNRPPRLKSVAHYLAKFECSTVRLFKSVTNSLFTVNIYRNVTFWSCLCQSIYSITACVYCLLSACTYALCRARQSVSATATRLGRVGSRNVDPCSAHLRSVDASMTRCCNALPSV